MKTILLLLPEHATSFLAQFRKSHPKWKASFISNKKLASILKRTTRRIWMPEFPIPAIHSIKKNLGLDSGPIRLFHKPLDPEDLPTKIYVPERAGDQKEQCTVFTLTK